MSMTPSDIAESAAKDFLGNGNGPARKHLERIILSAAAKMVQQTGAVEALEDAKSDIPFIRSKTGHKFIGRESTFNAALQSLRALTEHKL